MLREKNLPYMDAAKTLGYGYWRIWWRHALPAAKGPVSVAVAFGMANAVMITAFLSFIGLGLPPDVPTWGGLLNLARESTGDWWLAVFPGLALFLTLVSLNIVGDHISKQPQSDNKT
jgi:peptide/nickel transport system permease protein